MNEIILNYLTEEEKRTYQQALEHINNNFAVQKASNDYSLLLKNSFYELLFSLEELGKARYQQHIDAKLFKLQEKISENLSQLNQKESINFADETIIDFIEDAKAILNLTENVFDFPNEKRLKIFNDISSKNISTPELKNIINESSQLFMNN